MKNSHDADHVAKFANMMIDHYNTRLTERDYNDTLSLQSIMNTLNSDVGNRSIFLPLARKSRRRSRRRRIP